MRYFSLVLFAVLIINGCKKDNNIVSTSANQDISSSTIKDSIEYTLTVPKTSFGINDTLSLTFAALNQSSKPDTLVIGLNPNLYSWTLKEESGRTVMFGPMGADDMVEMMSIPPDQSKVMYSLHQAIKDTSGADVKKGLYILQWDLNNHSTKLVSLTLNITIQ